MGAWQLKVGYLLEKHARELQVGLVFGPSQGFHLPSGDTVQPDAALVSTERWSALPPPEYGKYLEVVPDLVVEVLSDSTASYDRGVKKDIYERSGVREYWLVDARARTVTVFARAGDKFDAGRVHGVDDRVASQVLSGLAFTPAELVGGSPRFVDGIGRQQKLAAAETRRTDREPRRLTSANVRLRAPYLRGSAGGSPDG